MVEYVTGIVGVCVCGGCRRVSARISSESLGGGRMCVCMLDMQ